MAQSIWKKGGSKISTSKKSEYISTEFALSDWLPGGVIVAEDQYPGQLMNSRRQTIYVWAGKDPMRGDLSAGIKSNTPTPIEVQEAIRSACLDFLKTLSVQALKGEATVRRHKAK